jgi:hypothetical protein
MAVVQFGCVGLYARVFDEQEPMRKLKDIDGLVIYAGLKAGASERPRDRSVLLHR